MSTKFFRSLIPLIAVAVGVLLFSAACGKEEPTPTPVGPAPTPTATPVAEPTETPVAVATPTPTPSPSPTPSPTPTPKVIVGAIHVGSVNDAGYNQAQHEGLVAMQKNLPYVQLLEAENVSETVDAERVMENMIQQGATIIFPQSFGYLEPALNLAAKYPKVVFAHPAGYRLAPNLGTYWAASDQLSYVLGMAAGRLTKTNRLGFVGSIPIPGILATVNAFHLGARSVNPDVQTYVVFTGSWLDPAKEASATNTLADQGVDAVTMLVDSPVTVVRTAEGRGMWSIGYHSKEVAKFAPTFWVSGIDFTWGGFFTRTVQEVRAGTWKSGHVRGDLTTDMVQLAPFGANVPESVQQAVLARKADFVAGRTFTFAGPIKDQEGNVRVKDGEVAGVEVINTMDWLAEGVIGRTE